VKDAVREPIAIVGMACRLPAAESPEDFWKLLSSGTDAVDRCSEDRSNWAARLQDVASFDNDFFSVSRREARLMDPQQRLMLELCWEATEDASRNADELHGERVGVYIGCAANDYADLAIQSGDEQIDHLSLTGVHRSLIANRLSYFMGWTGPSMTIDCGQSSSLVSVEQACAGLIRSDVDLAIAGGVQLNVSEAGSMLVSRFGALSPDGHCYTFDARANGYVRGEGGGLVVLKRLSSAVKDNDRIYAVIAGGAVNNDGGGKTLTVPDEAAQVDVLRRACSSAGIEPAQVDYVELHGTGTPVGDPVEAAAIGAVHGHGRAAESLRVGSVKTNIGHLEGAAGIAGLLKTTLCLHHRALVPTVGFERANPNISLDSLGIQVQTELENWRSCGERLIAGVTSLGMGGTNCHLVLTEAPLFNQSPVRCLGRPLPFVISARGNDALAAQAERLVQHLDENNQNLGDVAWSLAETRALHSHTATIVAADKDRLCKGLAALVDGRAHESLQIGTYSEPGRLVLAFAGQGTQRARMGLDLMVVDGFANRLHEVCELLDPHLDTPISRILASAPGTSDAMLLDQTAFTQPAIFAIEIALIGLMEQCGIRADVVVGHSIGEISAAVAAGVLTLPDACTLVVARGRLMQALPAGGSMASIEADGDEVLEQLQAVAGVDVAAFNSPSSTTISGHKAAVQAVVSSFLDRGCKAKVLSVSHAFHSHLMSPMMDQFTAVLNEISFNEPTIPIISTLTGAEVSSQQMCSPEYWSQHVRQPVQFRAAIETLANDGFDTFLELGPDGTLTGLARQCLVGRRVRPTLVSALSRNRDDNEAVIRALADLHTVGRRVNWSPLFEGIDKRRVPLPTYTFQRSHHWLSEAGKTSVARDARAPTSVKDIADSPQRTRFNPQTNDVATVVRSQTAFVIGVDEELVDVDRTFKDLGFNSHMLVELCDRVGRLLPNSGCFSLCANHCRVRKASTFSGTSQRRANRYCWYKLPLSW